MLLRLMNDPGILFSFHQGTITLVLKYNGFTFTRNTLSNSSSAISCDGPARCTTPAQLTTTSRRLEYFSRAVERMERHEDSSVMSPVKAWTFPGLEEHDATVLSFSALLMSTARTEAPSAVSFWTIWREIVC
ncbi:uncharacterized protein PV07_11785 [Cladophialophora immunda]|uniref:Uncharacterized protein n=1 Tax=Cladophialophora immunda TaxID=569365 RepID=A0A0D2BWY8_9EURO|nr:uncharacterized protein PV07_11785 [Cladophialophora immunda]KIW23598.1 hypothetical protein PV07_11785 [Cladophialophora immunda]